MHCGDNADVKLLLLHSTHPPPLTVMVEERWKALLFPLQVIFPSVTIHALSYWTMMGEGMEKALSTEVIVTSVTTHALSYWTVTREREMKKA
jgi:hypothetical protein